MIAGLEEVTEGKILFDGGLCEGSVPKQSELNLKIKRLLLLNVLIVVEDMR